MSHCFLNFDFLMKLSNFHPDTPTSQTVRQPQNGTNKIIIKYSLPFPILLCFVNGNATYSVPLIRGLGVIPESCFSYTSRAISSDCFHFSYHHQRESEFSYLFSLLIMDFLPLINAAHSWILILTCLYIKPSRHISHDSTA